MLGISFDFFKVVRWGLRNSLRALFSPLVWYPLLIITIIGIFLTFWGAVDTLFQPLYDVINFSIPHNVQEYFFGSDSSSSISAVLSYTFALDIVIHAFFRIPQYLVELLISALILVTSFYIAWYVNSFKIRAYNFVMGLIP